MSCDCGCACDSCQNCDCCQGTHAITPEMIDNRPGLPALRYRVGTHGSFLETMKARLSSQDFPALRRLTTRDPSDASIALLDAWATVGDVLSFYTERIANEGYLRTANERRSVLELARLVGYAPRPGVASSVFMAYTLEAGHTNVTIPKGTRAQSVPGPGELPQMFETNEALIAQSELSVIHPRLIRPQLVEFNKPIEHINIKGLNVSLRVGDHLLLGFAGNKYALYQIQNVVIDSARNCVRLEVALLDGTRRSPTITRFKPRATLFSKVLMPLKNLRSVQPANAAELKPNSSRLFQVHSDLALKLLSVLQPEAQKDLYKALESATISPPSELLSIEVIRLKAGLFGSSAPQTAVLIPVMSGEIPTGQLEVGSFEDPPGLRAPALYTQSSSVILDASFDQIKVNHRIAIVQKTGSNSHDIQIHTVLGADTVGWSQFGLTARVTKLEIASGFTNTGVRTTDGWPATSTQQTKTVIANTTVYVVGEKLEIADEVIEADIFSASVDSELELDGLYRGLGAGHWIIIQGERMLETIGVDGNPLLDANKHPIYHSSGIIDAELAMVAEVQHRFAEIELSKSENARRPKPVPKPWPGDSLHTFIQFAAPLQWRFKRDTVKIYANVVKASHGETRTEVLGSGDASLKFQSFELKQPPLTYLPAPTAAGAQSTLEVWVNEVRWDDTPFLAVLGANDRAYTVRIEDDGQTSVIFGNGVNGSRLPTGRENITARYRSGIGKPGNVAANTIKVLANKPFGVKEVINPIRASGGANRESRDQARRNAPLAVMALDRLVSVRDYEDFARTFAGIGKASATRLTQNGRALVHVTIAGLDDIPIDQSSDLYRNLLEAFRRLGDPQQPVVLAVRESLMLVVHADVRVGAAYLWELVEPKIRAAMLEQFSFEARELGQQLVSSEVLSVIQGVPGVEYVDLEAIGYVSLESLKDSKNVARYDKLFPCVLPKLGRLAPVNEDDAPDPLAAPVSMGSVGASRIKPPEPKPILKPAQITYLTPVVREVLILNEIKG
jgi:Baseplate J-like protein